MTLEFTNIPDREGPAVYLLGNRMLSDRLQRLGNEIDTALPDDTQVVYLDVDSGDGAAVKGFYGIEDAQLPAVLIVQDDDQIYQGWYGEDLPSVEVVAQEIRQITGSMD